PLYLFMNDKDVTWSSLQLIAEADWRHLFLVLLATALRDIGYIIRIRVLTHADLSWLSCFYVVVLWEFASAVTPSVAGGGIVAIFLFLREGVNLGKALAYVVVITIFDNLFFLGATSLGFFGVYDTIFAELATLESKLGRSLQLLLWSSQAFVATYTLVMSLAIFRWPKFFKWFLVKATSIRFLKRWQPAAGRYGDDLILASETLQGEKLLHWLKVGVATLLTWTSRYLVLNFIIAAYVSLDFVGHLVVLGKQFIIWTIMLVSPTPGSSGTAEFFYKQLYGNALGDYTLITAVLWRVFTYYLYLILGAIYLPRWIRRIFSLKKDNV
ncbi:MAG: lysylphosphatidylglycerol synthase transmembrane domain-containing protein, partial [Bacteroidota bacterium]